MLFQRRSKFSFGILLAGAVALGWTGAAPAATLTYDAVTDFSITNGNPNGFWSYRADGTLLTHTENINGNAANPAWDRGSSEPNFRTIGIVGAGYLTIPANTSVLNLDPEGGTVTVRFKPTYSGTFTVTGYFLGDDNHGGVTHPVTIDKDGATSLFASTITSFHEQKNFSLSVALLFGDYIDFNVSVGTDYRYLSTGLSALITTTTPLPAALPLFASGLGAIGVTAWRRKRKARAA